MRRTLSIFLALALVLGFSIITATPVAAATTYYVATTGNDGNPGSAGSPWLTIKYAISQVGAGDTIMVAAGTYPEPSETTITQDVTIIGADKTTTIIKKAGGWTGSYFFRVNGGRLSLSNVTLDGEGNLYGGVRLGDPATGTIDNNIFKNIVSSGYTGFGVVGYANNAVVSNNILTNIGRVGIWFWGNNNSATGNTYTGKGPIDCLDYAVEVEGGSATINSNTVTNCTGVASSDGSTSAGILVTTYFSPTSNTVTITGNTLTGNTEGIAVGYDGSDYSTVVANYNDIYGNSADGVHSTAPTVDATYNWWGADDGPSGCGPGTTGDSVSANVNYVPWATKTATGTGNAYITPGAGTITGLMGTAAPAGAPVSFPYGMFSFVVTGITDNVTLTIELPGPMPVGSLWYKYNGGSWDPLPIGDDDGDNVITVTLRDNISPDDEDVTLGQITDQGGPSPGAVGWETYSVDKTRVLLPWIALLAAIMAGGSVLVVRRRRAQS